MVYQELDPLPRKSEQMTNLAVLTMPINVDASGETAGMAVGAGPKCAHALTATGTQP